MLTQTPTKIPVEIENQRFSFHCAWHTRNIGRQGVGEIRLNMNAKESIVFIFKVHLPYAHAILLTITSHSNQLQFFQSSGWGGGGTSAGRSVNFDSFSEVGYRSP